MSDLETKQLDSSVLEDTTAEISQGFMRSRLKFLNNLERICKAYEEKPDSPVVVDLVNMKVTRDTGAIEEDERYRTSKTKTSNVVNKRHNKYVINSYCKKLQEAYFNSDSDNEPDRDEDDEEDDKEDEADDKEAPSIIKKEDNQERILLNILQDQRKRLSQMAFDDGDDDAWSTVKQKQPRQLTDKQKSDEMLKSSTQTSKYNQMNGFTKNNLNNQQFNARQQSSASFVNNAWNTTRAVKSVRPVATQLKLFRYTPKKSRTPKDSIDTTTVKEEANEPTICTSKRSEPLSANEMHLLNMKQAKAFAKSTGQTISQRTLQSPIYLAAWMKLHNCPKATIVSLSRDNFGHQRKAISKKMGNTSSSNNDIK
ncbi:hypothetical protein BDF19DRAFT_424924 [Syncephalis fuscata]|nr:hypothetical protein BDF19DRAFT_424924 [Syncephalis fuscata]